VRNAEIEGLIRLSVLDAKGIKLRREMAELPQSLARRKAAVGAQAARVAANQDEQKRLAKEIDKLDLEVKSNLEQIQKYQVQQNTAKTNEAYQALQHEINDAKKKNAAFEDQALLHYERIDALKEEQKTIKADLAGDEARLKGDEAEVAKEVAAMEAALEKLAAERDEIEKRISGDIIKLYRRILENTRDRALAPVNVRTCQGCFMEVPSNAVNILLQGKDIVQCKNCARILYLEQDYRATTSISYAVNDRGDTTSKDGNW